MTLAADDLTFAYRRGRPAVRGVSLDIPPGVRTALVGPNGAGKSTLCALLVGALVARKGRVTLAGRPLVRTPRHLRAGLLSYMNGAASFGAPLTASHVIALSRRCRPDDPGVIDTVTERLGLGPLMGSPVTELSAGQAQRVSLARAVAQVWDAEGAVLIADEPTSAMDPRFAQRSLDVLSELSSRGVGVLAAMHDLTAAARFASHAVVMADGGTVAHAGPAGEVLTPAHLRGVFGVDFASGQTAGGPVVTTVPDGHTADRAGGTVGE